MSRYCETKIRALVFALTEEERKLVLEEIKKLSSTEETVNKNKHDGPALRVAEGRACHER